MAGLQWLRSHQTPPSPFYLFYPQEPSLRRRRCRHLSPLCRKVPTPHSLPLDRVFPKPQFCFSYFLYMSSRLNINLIYIIYGSIARPRGRGGTVCDGKPRPVEAHDRSILLWIQKLGSLCLLFSFLFFPLFFSFLS